MLKIVSTLDAALLSKLNEPVQQWHVENYPDRFKPFDQKSIEIFFRKLLENEHAKAYVASLNHQPAAYLLTIVQNMEDNAFSYANKVLNIDQIGVLPEFRRQGIGSALIQHAVEQARKNGINRVIMDHWGANLPAESLFNAVGFKLLRRQMFIDL